jgi:putative transposase
LVLENALFRQQLIVLKRSVKRPKLTNTGRRLLVALSSRLPPWESALVLVKPETILQWHRQLFKQFWRRKSRGRVGRPKLSAEIIALIKQMAQDNRLWGAERIRGELLKLDLHVCKRTIQKYIRQVRGRRQSKQTWTTFLHTHAQDVWACDFLPVFNLFFQQYFVFFIIELASRRVVHFGVTNAPSDAWVAQQLREATPFDQRPTYLVRDNDSKYGHEFTRVAAGAGIKVLNTPVAAPNANAVCERFLESVRYECLDQLLVLSQRHLYRMVKAYVIYFNAQRPHQGIDQGLPIPMPSRSADLKQSKIITSTAVLGGLHTVYEWAA